MKSILITVLLALTFAVSQTQNQIKMEVKEIEQFIQEYALAVDKGNAALAGNFLDKDFRVVLNNHNNSGNKVIFSREQYLNLMQNGKVGGNKRKLTFLLTDVHENGAIVKVRLEGEKNIFTNYYNLLKSKGGWSIINDQPQIISK